MALKLFCRVFVFRMGMVVGWWLVVGVWWSVVSGWWVDRGPVGGSVVGSRWPVWSVVL